MGKLNNCYYGSYYLIKSKTNNNNIGVITKKFGRKILRIFPILKLNIEELSEILFFLCNEFDELYELDDREDDLTEYIIENFDFIIRKYSKTESSIYVIDEIKLFNINELNKKIEIDLNTISLQKILNTITEKYDFELRDYSENLDIVWRYGFTIQDKIFVPDEDLKNSDEEI